jgi:hypothetical protein
MTDPRGHLQFLKPTKNWLHPGEYLPDPNRFADGRLRSILAARSCMFLFFIDTECEPCGPALNMLYEALSEYDLPAVLLVAAPEDKKFDIIRTTFEGKAELHRCDMKEMKRLFGTGATPWGYGINAVGQIVTSSVCGSRSEFSALTRPFRRLIGATV